MDSKGCCRRYVPAVVPLVYRSDSTPARLHRSSSSRFHPRAHTVCNVPRMALTASTYSVHTTIVPLAAVPRSNQATRRARLLARPLSAAVPRVPCPPTRPLAHCPPFLNPSPHHLPSPVSERHAQDNFGAYARDPAGNPDGRERALCQAPSSIYAATQLGTQRASVLQYFSSDLAYPHMPHATIPGATSPPARTRSLDLRCCRRGEHEYCRRRPGVTVRVLHVHKLTTDIEYISYHGCLQCATLQ